MGEESTAGVPHAETIVVECPHCDNQFETHDVGDMAGCPECKQTFSRFTSIAEDG